ncbi:MAG: hypothetical protein QXR81_07630 [Candidatus Nezhaarchaeales archaeon]
MGVKIKTRKERSRFTEYLYLLIKNERETGVSYNDFIKVVQRYRRRGYKPFWMTADNGWIRIEMFKEVV